MNENFGVGLHCGAQYPQEPPVECIKSLVAAYREGTLFEDRACTAHHIWNIQGYAQRLAFGDPHDDHPPLIGANATVELTDEQAIDDLQAVVNAEENHRGSYAALPIPWTAIAAWAIKLLLERLNK